MPGIFLISFLRYGFIIHPFLRFLPVTFKSHILYIREKLWQIYTNPSKKTGV
nr:MAG TPA: hypothetical protein [Caudoviricetes sp.]